MPYKCFRIPLLHIIPRNVFCINFVSDAFAMDDDGMLECACLPACSEITYDVETSQSTFRWAEVLKAVNAWKGTNISI
ncbi:hypothetical protein ANN_12605, partial [Periplaneta americana]